MTDPLDDAPDDEMLLARAASAGFRLVQHESDTGQLIWEWWRGNQPGPQFVTRRVAIDWMKELLERSSAVPFVSSAGGAH